MFTTRRDMERWIGDAFGSEAPGEVEVEMLTDWLDGMASDIGYASFSGCNPTSPVMPWKQAFEELARQSENWLCDPDFRADIVALGNVCDAAFGSEIGE